MREGGGQVEGKMESVFLSSSGPHFGMKNLTIIRKRAVVSSSSVYTVVACFFYRRCIYILIPNQLPFQCRISQFSSSSENKTLNLTNNSCLYINENPVFS